ncbi:tetratricopeptide repeat protein [Salinimonas sp. HHU 13199]|uniref:Tetratricopeptide repeat protein n=1 Tax=Salinimonas profundi TaxID=2729140 RepID=A0ABR8LJ51_9ALTE|nr:tetratricopeptide repeat protein [Salinimonas profundi]MBD3586247.1 tetratricopeptide repeat protein [Salinimonas profundi]
MHEKFKINHFSIDPDDNTVTSEGVKRHVEPKAMQVLLALAEHAEKTVSRQYLLETAWGNRVVVDEALTRIISQLRNVFDDSKLRTLIQTVPKKGYRLNARVTLAEDAQKEASHSEDAPANIQTDDAQVISPGNTEIVSQEIIAQEADNTGSTTDDARVTVRSQRKSLIMLIEVLCVVVLIFLWFSSKEPDTSPSQVKSVAVLPLAPIGNNKQTEYLAQGLSEELQGALSGLKGLRVPSRYSTFAQADNYDAPTEIARALDVEYLIEGSIAQRADTFKVVYRLIDAKRDETLWSHSYEGEAVSLPQITHNVAKQVKQYLQPDASPLAAEKEPANSTSVAAYQAYMRGKYWLMNGKTSEWFMQASAAFHQAIESDPEYAQAYGSLAYIYARYNFHDAYLQPDEATQKAQWAINKALALNPDERNALLATAILSTTGQAFTKAESALNKVLGKNAQDSTALYLYSELRLAQNQYDQALELAQKARQADPLSPWINVNLAIVYFHRGQYAQALEAANTAIDVDKSYTWAYVWKAKTLFASGQVKDAIQSMQICLDIDNASPVNNAFTGLLYLELEMPEKADAYFRQTATLFGDSVDARFWKNFTRFGYHHQKPEIARQLLINVKLLDNRIFTLMPLLTSLYLQQDLSEEGVEQIALRYGISTIDGQQLNHLNKDIVSAFAALSGNDVFFKSQHSFSDARLQIPPVYPLLAASQQAETFQTVNVAPGDKPWWSYMWVLPDLSTLQLKGNLKQQYQQFTIQRAQQREQVEAAYK